MMNAEEFSQRRATLIQQYGRMLADGEKSQEYLKAVAPLVKHAKVHEDRLTSSIIGDWIAANPEWKKAGVSAVPHEPEPLVAVYQDAERHSCIKLGVDAKKRVIYIPMETVLDVHKASQKDFEQRYIRCLKDYSVKQAARMYLGASWLSVTEEAKEHLEYLLSSKFTDTASIINFDNKEYIMTAATQEKTKAKKVAAPKAEKKVDKKPEPVKSGRRATDPEVPVKKGAAKVATPKVAKSAGTGKAGRKPAGPDNRKIKLLTKENPKRGASAERFALYKNGMTVDAYVEAGGKREDVAWDVKKGYITAE